MNLLIVIKPHDSGHVIIFHDMTYGLDLEHIIASTQSRQ